MLQPKFAMVGKWENTCKLVKAKVNLTTPLGKSDQYKDRMACSQQ